MSSESVAEQQQGILGAIERVGNRLPDPDSGLCCEPACARERSATLGRYAENLHALSPIGVRAPCDAWRRGR